MLIVKPGKITLMQQKQSPYRYLHSIADIQPSAHMSSKTLTDIKMIVDQPNIISMEISGAVFSKCNTIQSHDITRQSVSEKLLRRHFFV